MQRNEPLVNGCLAVVVGFFVTAELFDEGASLTSSSSEAEMYPLPMLKLDRPGLDGEVSLNASSVSITLTGLASSFDMIELLTKPMMLKMNK